MIIANKHLFQYGFMAIPISFAGLPLYIHMPNYYTQDFGLNIGLLGTILLFIRILDALQDPLIGYISDLYPHRRMTIVIWGMVALVLGLGGLSFGPLIPMSIALWFMLCMILATTGFSVISITINTIGGLWGTDTPERVRISAWREGLGLIGLILAAILPTLLHPISPMMMEYMLSFMLFLGIVIVALILFYQVSKTIPHRPNIQQNPQQKSLRFKHMIDIFSGNKIFFAVCLLSYVSAGLPAVMVLFFIDNYLNAAAFSGVFLLLYFISGAVFMGSWVKISAKYGAVYTWQMAMGLSVITFAAAIFLQSGDIVFYGLICMASGIALGADLALPPAIIGGRMGKAHTQATQYYAMLAFLSKIALALAAGIAFIPLYIVGFNANDSTHSPTALMVLLGLYTLVPCIFRILAISGLWHLKQQETTQ